MLLLHMTFESATMCVCLCVFPDSSSNVKLGVGLKFEICLALRCARSWHISGRSTAALAPCGTLLQTLAGAYISTLFVLIRTGQLSQYYNSWASVTIITVDRRW